MVSRDTPRLIQSDAPLLESTTRLLISRSRDTLSHMTRSALSSLEAIIERPNVLGSAEDMLSDLMFDVTRSTESNPSINSQMLGISVLLLHG